MPVICVIEDERSIADNIVYALESDGFTAQWFELGLEAIEPLKEGRFDFVILDIGLPDITGFELCKNIRKFSNIPIVILTARAEEIDKVVGLEIGADDYMVKPFSPRELTARVRAILRRVQNNGNAQVAAGMPFSIDEDKNSIRYFDQALDLSRYEYRMLKIFIEKPGWVFSREQLMRLAWEEEDTSFDRTVDTHIKTLRAKMKKIREDIDPIITRRGLGYALKEDW